MDDCGQIIKRLDDLESRFGQKMDILSKALTQLAVQQQQAAENTRRLNKLEIDVDKAFGMIRDEKDKREDEIAEIRCFQETCPKAKLEESRKQGRELIGLAILYILVEAAKFLLSKYP